MNERQMPGFMERVRQARLPGQCAPMASQKMTGILCKVISSQLGNKGKRAGKSKAKVKSAKGGAMRFGPGRFH